MNDIYKEKVQLTIGPRKSGKSEYIESMLSKWSNRVYVGTLWKEPKFDELLHLHRSRRDSIWRLVECNGYISDDLIQIQNALDLLERPAACMIDGLTTWAIHCGKITKDFFESAREVANGLVGLIYNNPDVYWNLVDVREEDFFEKEPLIYGHVHKILHNLLRISVPNMKINNWKEYKDAKISSLMDR